MSNEIQLVSDAYAELINTIIRVMIIPLLPVLTAYLIALIKKQIAEIDGKMNTEEISRYMNLAENAIITAVTAVNQTYVDNIKAKDGKLSPYDQKVAFELAREKTLKILGEKAIQKLKLLYNDFDSWLENQIEYYVNQIKNQSGSVRQSRL